MARVASSGNFRDCNWKHYCCCLVYRFTMEVVVFFPPIASFKAQILIQFNNQKIGRKYNPQMDVTLIDTIIISKQTNMMPKLDETIHPAGAVKDSLHVSGLKFNRGDSPPPLTLV